MKFLVPLALALAGVGAGVGTGVVLRPDSAAADAHGTTKGYAASSDAAHTEPDAHGGGSGAATDPHATAGASHGSGHARRTTGAEYVDLRNQFIIPILERSAVRSFVVLDLDLEVAAGTMETVTRLEPKIRDAFLTVLFDHANAGGFNGTFTSSGAMDVLRASLREAGQKVVGAELLSDVLITSIVRQEV